MSDDDPFKDAIPLRRTENVVSFHGADAESPPLDAYADEARRYDGDNEGDSGTAKRASVFFPASDYYGKEVPPRSWVASGLIPGKTVTILGGDGGTGKSLVALQLAVSMASGRTWLGREIATGPVIYISAEDDEDELHRRLADIARAEDLGLDELDQLTVRSLAGEDALIAATDARTGVMHSSPLYDEIDKEATRCEPVMIVLDTLADLFPGNENDRAQARQFIGLLRGIAIKHDCAILLLAHPSLTGLNSGSGSSGSTAWNNSVRSRIYFSRVIDDGYEADPDARILATKKANYGRVGEEIGVKWRDGVFVADAPDTGLDRLARSSKAERVFLRLLEETLSQGRKVNHAGGQNYAPNVFATHPDSEGCSRQALRSAMEKHLATGRIVVAEDGPPSRRRQFLDVGK